METIYSLVTKPINQNVAIIRISGPDAFKAIKNLVKDFVPKQNTVLFKEIEIDNKFLDQALILSFIAPNSFTGENVIEIQSHGNMYIVEQILNELSKQDIRASEPGEFMKQAFMNNKIDLTQSEAINTLILSENKSLTERSKLNLSGKQTDVINQTINKLTQILAKIQISIDYPENTDLPEYSKKGIKELLIKHKNEMIKIISNSKSLIKISKGIKVALIGKPNAGKSSLMNALLDEERAIVSEFQGTTRDVIESSLIINDVKVTLQDTAGLRETNDLIEKEGIKKTMETLVKADIVIVIEEPSDRIDYINLNNFKNKIIKVMNKNDLEKNVDHDYISISALNKQIEPLLNKLKEVIKHDLTKVNIEDAMLITSNQVKKFEDVLNHINESIKLIEDDLPIDIISLEVEQAIKKLGLILGTEIDQDYITNLFATFCIGK